MKCASGFAGLVNWSSTCTFGIFSFSCSILSTNPWKPNFGSVKELNYEFTLKNWIHWRNQVKRIDSSIEEKSMIQVMMDGYDTGWATTTCNWWEQHLPNVSTNSTQKFSTLFIATDMMVTNAIHTHTSIMDFLTWLKCGHIKVKDSHTLLNNRTEPF